MNPCVIARGTTMTMNPGWLVVPFDTEISDADGLHTSGQPTRVTIPAGVSGTFELCFVAPVNSFDRVQFLKNGAPVGHELDQKTSAYVLFDTAVAGDYYEVKASNPALGQSTLPTGFQFIVLKV